MCQVGFWLNIETGCTFCGCLHCGQGLLKSALSQCHGQIAPRAFEHAAHHVGAAPEASRYGVSRQSPSKLIDYFLCGRPVLSLRSFELDRSLVDQFLEGDYRKALVIDKPEQYRIENVVDRFMALV